MKRHKRRIHVSIAALKGEAMLAEEAIEDAYRYADEVHVIEMGRRKPTREFQDLATPPFVFVHAVPVTPDRPQARAMAYRRLWPNSHYPEDVVIMFMEVGWRVSDTDSVRNAIEFNPEKILTATRYFQWDDDHYRVDDLFRPRRVPFAARARQGVHWTSGIQTAPDWMWTQRTRWVEAPIDIIDVTFLDHTDQTYRWDTERSPQLRLMPGRPAKAFS